MEEKSEVNLLESGVSWFKSLMVRENKFSFYAVVLFLCDIATVFVIVMKSLLGIVFDVL
jgi:hypothetical protein